MKFLSLAILLLLSAYSSAQEKGFTKDIVDGDTIFYAPNIGTVSIISRRFEDREDRTDFFRLLRNIKKVYPYVKMADELYDEISAQMDSIPRKRKRRKYRKLTEQELRAEFAEEITKMTKYQGKLLIMLINRETGDNCYAILKELKNRFAAFFIQGGAMLYGHDLKAKYIPADNPDIELIWTGLDEMYGDNYEKLLD